MILVYRAALFPGQKGLPIAVVSSQTCQQWFVNCDLHCHCRNIRDLTGVILYRVREAA